MGNNNSRELPPTSVDVVRRPPSRPGVPPSSRPISDLGPHGPSYSNPENQVLPKILPSMIKLRPVSMELSKYNPDYQNIYSVENDENDNTDIKNNEDGNGEEKRGDTPEKDKNESPPRPPPPTQNGHIPGTENNSPTKTQTPNGQVVTDVKTINNSVKPQNSAPYRPSHRRQLSLTTNLTGQQHVIHEENEENIDSRVKLDPLMQSFPGATGPSLPVKNNFNLDYSYQLTYVQLAEHRRNKTIEDLEKKTGKKLSDLSADLSNNTQQPEFMRDAPSRVSTRSTNSGGTALSTKTKRAPAPPGSATAPTSPRTPRTTYSLDNEPPIDYDMASSPRRNTYLPRYAAVTPVPRSPTKSSQVPPPPPAPPTPSGASSPRKPGNLSRNHSMSNEKPEIILKRTPNVKQTPNTPESADGHVPWLLEIKNLSESRAARRQMSQEESITPDIPVETIKYENSENKSEQVENVKAKTKLVFESSNDEFTHEVDGEKNTLERGSSVKSKKTYASPQLQRHHSTTTFDRSPDPKLQRQSSVPVADPARRLSSLLQHDIKSTANAKCLKLVKQTTPVLPRPKDPHTMFREQLQKACADRDDRVQTEGTIDDILKRSESVESDSKKTSFELESEKEINENKSSKSNDPPDTLPKPPRYHKNVSINRNSSAYTRPRQMVPKNEQSKNRNSSSFDWTPEDDLESDDNLSDREEMSLRKGSSDGFKQTIVPSNVNDLKLKKGKKDKKSKAPTPSDEQINNKNKFGSVKKFKKSMHKSVKNAFGSISKASGKILLRKQRGEDLEVVEDAPKNWKLASNGPNVVMNGSRDRSLDYLVTNGYSSDSDSEKFPEFHEISFQQNGIHDSEDESSEDDDSLEKTPRKIKRAGVAYVGADGQIHVLPDENTHHSLKRDLTLNKDKKKKQQNFESGTSKRKEKELALQRAQDETREKERMIEEEKRKQLEMELEMHKIREAETRERLQRLENAHMQSRINAQLIQQQSQQQGISMLSAPPLPPAGTYPPNYSNMQDAAQTQAFTNLFGQPLPQNGYQSNFGGIYNQQTGSMMNGSGMPYDINDYMRMLGMQTPPTSQQMAFVLNNMNLTAGQPYDRKSNPTLFNVINQDPLKQFPNNGTVNFQMMDPAMSKQGFQTWASTPNVHTPSAVVSQNTNTVPIGDFMNSYNNYNGATSNNVNDGNKQKGGKPNPLYNSDDSDEGLSPSKTVARAQVKDYRQVPVRTESGKFMKKYGAEIDVTLNGNRQNLNIERTDFTREQQAAKNVSYNGGLPQRQGSVSPSNSTSTLDSAITSSSVTVSPPPSPASSTMPPASPMVATKHTTSGYRTILDLTAPDTKTQISMYQEDK